MVESMSSCLKTAIKLPLIVLVEKRRTKTVDSFFKCNVERNQMATSRMPWVLSMLQELEENRAK